VVPSVAPAAETTLAVATGEGSAVIVTEQSSASPTNG
jgi:hypothetical protein